MKLHEAYRILGLRPFEQFLAESQGDRIRGSTTWMLVEAAIHIDEGGEGVIVGRDLKYAELLADKCRSYILKLNPQGVQTTRRPLGRTRFREFPGSGKLWWQSPRTMDRFWLGRSKDIIQVFSDFDYKRMALQRKGGPYAEIRDLVRQPDGNYQALNERGKYLMTLDEEGAHHMADADPFRINFR